MTRMNRAWCGIALCAPLFAACAMDGTGAPNDTAPSSAVKPVEVTAQPSEDAAPSTSDSSSVLATNRIDPRDPSKPAAVPGADAGGNTAAAVRRLDDGFQANFPPELDLEYYGGDTLRVGATETILIETDRDVGPTPYYIYIYDGTIGQVLARCGSGTRCSANISQSTATTHDIWDFVDVFDTTYPKSGYDVGIHRLVTWSNSGYWLQLQPDWELQRGAWASPCYAGGFDAVTATASVDVGPTPYFIQIFDISNGAPGVRIAECGSGTTCSASLECGHTGTATIAPSGSGLPIPNAQASSNDYVSTAVPN